MSQMPPKSRVSSGIPWWLWLMMISFTGIVILNSASSFISEDPEKLFSEAVASYEKKNEQPIGPIIKKLEAFPEYAGQVELLKGLEQLSLSRPLKAVPFLENASKDPKTEQLALLGLGDLYARVGELPKAVELLGRLLEKQPENAQARNLYCLILDQVGAYEALISALKDGVDKGYTESAANTNAKLGETVMALERYDEAAGYLEVALKEETVARTQADLALKLVRCLLKSGQAEKLLSFVDRVERQEDREAHRGLALLSLGRNDEAAAAAEKIGSGSEYEVVVQSLRARLAMLGDKATAKQMVARLEPLQLTMPRNIEFYEVMVDLAKAADMSDTAVVFQDNIHQLSAIRDEYRALRDRIIADQTDSQGRMRAGDLAAELGDTAQADKWYRAAQSIDPALQGVVKGKLESLFGIRPPLVQLNRINLVGFETLMDSIADGVDALP